MKLSEFKADKLYWTEQEKITEFGNEHMTEVFLNGLKQYIHTTGQIIQINEEDMKWRDITGQTTHPPWQTLK